MKLPKGERKTHCSELLLSLITGKVKLMTTQLEKLAEQLGNKYLPQDAGDISPTNSKCWIAPVADGDIKTDYIYSDTDIYDLLESDDAVRVAREAGLNDGLAIFTCGWGAPINGHDPENEVPASKHPLRRRVALLIFATPTGEFVSAMRVGNDELLTNSDGEGALHDAVMELWMSR